MELLSFTLNQKTERKTLRGREYIVAPLSMLVSGVLNGSKGPLLYPVDEIENNPDAWNGMPIVVNHPLDDNNTPISARSPQVLEEHGIGTVFNVRVENGTLKADGWFDVEDTGRVDNSILSALESGSEIELSTGLFTDQEEAPENAVHNESGKSYTHIARNYRPDHLAILPTTKGACSIADGCGVLVNEEDQKNLEYLDEWGMVLNAKLPPNAKLNKPFRTPDGPKKFGVYVKSSNSDGVKLVRFGDSNMSIKRDNPDARKNFRSRHNCDNPGPKDKPRYWSCKMWQAGKSVSQVLANEDGFTSVVINIKPNDLSIEEFHTAVHKAFTEKLGESYTPYNERTGTPGKSHWHIRDIYIDHAIVEVGEPRDRDLLKYDFTVSDNVVSLSESEPVEVTRRVTYNPVSTNNNLTSNTGEDMKEELITNLITNCECWNENDKVTLNKLSEEQLKALQPDCTETVTTNTTSSTVTVTETPVVTVNTEQNQLTEEQWMAQAPASVRKVIANAQHVEMQEKQKIASQLVANVQEGQKESTYQTLLAKDLSELRLMQSLIPAKAEPTANFQAAAMYPMIPQGSQPVTNYGLSDEDAADFLTIPSLIEEAS